MNRRRPARRGALRVAAALLTLGVASASVQADGADKYPDRPVKLMMPFPAGGTGDVVACQLAAALMADLLAGRVANDLAYWQRAVAQNHIRIEQ